MSAFDEWFRLQCGARQKTQRTDQELREIVEAGRQAEAELSHRSTWDRMQTAARYAWNLDQRDKQHYAECAERRLQVHDHPPAHAG